MGPLNLKHSLITDSEDYVHYYYYQHNILETNKKFGTKTSKSGLNLQCDVQKKKEPPIVWLEKECLNVGRWLDLVTTVRAPNPTRPGDLSNKVQRVCTLHTWYIPTNYIPPIEKAMFLF